MADTPIGPDEWPEEAPTAASYSSAPPVAEVPLAPEWAPPVTRDQVDPLFGDWASSSAADDVDLPGMPGTKTQTKNSRSGSFKGMTDDGRAQVEKLWGPPSGKRDAISAKTDKLMAPRLAETREIKAKYDEADVLRKEATTELSVHEKAYHERLRAHADEERDFFETQRAMEEDLHHQGIQEREKYLGAYQQELGAVKALIATNANPLAKMGGTAALGMGMAQFAQGFLAAQGIQINVSGQIDKWIDREFQQHQQLIENTSNLAEKQLTLYGIARQGAKDDAESRSRLRGFVIEGFKANLVAESERFQSDIGAAKVKMQLANLDREATANRERMGTQYFNEWTDAHKTVLHEHIEKGKLAMQARAAKIEEDKLRATAAAAAKKELAEKVGKLMYDDTISGGGKAVRLRRDGVTDPAWTAVVNLKGDQQALDEKTAAYIDLVKRHGNLQLSDSTRLATPEGAKMKALQGDIFMLRTKILTGLASTGSQDAKIGAGTPEALFGGNDEAVIAVLGQTRAQAARATDVTIANHTDALDDVNDPTKELRARKNVITRFGAVEQAEAGSDRDTGGTKTAGPVDLARGGMVGANSGKRADKEFIESIGAHEAQNYWAHFGKTAGDIVMAPTPGSVSKLESALNLGSPSFYRRVEALFDDSEGKVPNFGASIVALAEEADKGNKEAIGDLQRIAYETDVGDDDKLLAEQAFARYMAQQKDIKLDSTRKPEPQRYYVRQGEPDNRNGGARPMTRMTLEEADAYDRAQLKKEADEIRARRPGFGSTPSEIK